MRLEVVAGFHEQVTDAGRAEHLADESDGPLGELFERTRLLADLGKVVERPEAQVDRLLLGRAVDQL